MKTHITVAVAALACLLSSAGLAIDSFCARTGTCSDLQDPPVQQCPWENGGSGGGGCQSCSRGNGPGGKQQYAGAGMAEWWVSQPYMNLRLEDMPLWYEPALGERIEFKLSYRQRGAVVEYPGVFGVGTNWSCSFRAYVWQAASGLKVHQGGAGVINHELNVPQFRNQTVLTQTSNQYVMYYPDGSTEVYGRSFTPGTLGTLYFLTARTNSAGLAVVYHYENDNTRVRLLQIEDASGQYTRLYYTNSAYPNQITHVVSPAGRTNALQYDSEGFLTNIIDMAGLSSGFGYDQGSRRPWITNLVTGYGTTGFSYGGVDVENQNLTSNGQVNRYVEVALPTGGKHLYLYLHDGSSILTNDFLAYPNTLPFPNMLDLSARNARNSFHWNPLQYSSLSSTVPSSLATADYLKAHRHQWLVDQYGAPTSVLSTEQLPSPDGTTEGLITWYDHEGKSDSAAIGTSALPLLTVRILPNGSTWLERTERNSLGNVTNRIDYWQDNAGELQFRTNVFVYESNEIDLRKHIGPDGTQVVSNSFNGYHRLLSTADALSQVTRYSYDTLQRPTRIERPGDGLTTIFEYYAANGAAPYRLERVVESEIGRTNTYTYYTNGLLAVHTNERGVSQTNYWDDLQRLVGTADARGSTSNQFQLLDLVGTRDRLGNWTRYGMNAIRQKVSETNANGVVTRYGYCECGTLSAVTNAWGTPAQQITTFSYDFQGNRIYEFRPDVTLTNWYDSLGRVIAAGDGTVLRYYWYNHQGLVTNVTTAAGSERLTQYDIEDRPIRVTDASSVTVTNAYDALGRLVARGQVARASGGPELFTYSALGLTAHTTQNTQSTYYVYNAAGWKLYETNANLEVTQFRYDRSGNLTNLVDGKNQSTRWGYDPFGRVTNKVDQAGATILRYAYDSNDRLTNRWSAAKGNTGYTYDLMGNLTFINYPASSDVTLQYDWLNRLTNMVDASGTSKYAYSAGGLLWTEDGPFASDTVTNTYQNRLRTSLSLQQPAGIWTNQFQYDAAGRLIYVTSPAGTYGYWLAGAGMLVKQVDLPGGGYITNIHDGLARLTGTYLKNSAGSTFRKHEYVHDSVHRRTQQVFEDGTSVTYSYDNIGQLKVADSSVSTEDRGYAYDKAWNLSYRTNSGALSSFTVDVKNQLGTAAGANCSYDANGNLVQVIAGTSLTAYSYDDENQLVMVTNGPANAPPPQMTIMSPQPNGGWKAEFTYDGQGRLRVRRDYYANSTGYSLTNTTRYIYDGKRVIQERDGSNVPVVSYTRGTDLSGSLEGAGGIGGLLARSQGTTHASYFADGNGNITALSSGNLNVVAAYRYDPYGNLVSKSGTLADANLYRFSSKEFHVNSGLYYYLYRFYHPNFQRWINRDPLGDRGVLFRVASRYRRLFLIGEIQEGPNLYSSVRNSPTLNSDPDGREILHYCQAPSGEWTCKGPDIGEDPISCGLRIKNDVWDKFNKPEHNSTDPNFHYGHCVAHCRIARECPGGRFTSWIGGFSKEVEDQLKKWFMHQGPGFDMGDMDANREGRNRARNCPTESCEEACKGTEG